MGQGNQPKKTMGQDNQPKETMEQDNHPKETLGQDNQPKETMGQGNHPKRMRLTNCPSTSRCSDGQTVVVIAMNDSREAAHAFDCELSALLCNIAKSIIYLNVEIRIIVYINFEGYVAPFTLLLRSAPDSTPAERNRLKAAMKTHLCKTF